MYLKFVFVTEQGNHMYIGFAVLLYLYGLLVILPLLTMLYASETRHPVTSRIINAVTKNKMYMA